MTKDIFNFVDFELIKNGFWSKDDEGKFSLIEEKLKAYTAMKLASMSGFSVEKDVSLEDALYIADGLFENDSDKASFFDNYTHYLLGTFSNIQHHEITWEMDNELQKSAMRFDFTEKEQIDKLVTNRMASPVEVTLFTFDALKSRILKGNKVK